MKNWMLLLALMATFGFGMGLTGCEEKADTPAEKIEDAKDDAKDAADDAADAVKDAADDAADAVKDATN